MAVGARQSLPSYRNARHHCSGSRQPQPKKLVQGTSRTRPRSTSTETTTLGAHEASLGIGNSIIGSRPRSVSTRASITPSRSTVTSAVASRNGMRTCKRAVSPDSHSRFSGNTSMRSSLPCANHCSASPLTHSVVAACATRAASSLARATSSTSPTLANVVSQRTRPWASLVPWHTRPSSRVWLALS